MHWLLLSKGQVNLVFIIYNLKETKRKKEKGKEVEEKEIEEEENKEEKEGEKRIEEIK